MSVSADIKQYLAEEIQRRKPCCRASFEDGSEGRIYKEQCPVCRSAFIGGAFLGYGSITDPEKAFHLELKVEAAFGDKLSAVLAEEGIEPRAYSLKGGRVRLYYKTSGAISDFLTFVGASRFALEVMDKEVMNSIKFKENRKSNAAIANMDRTATAAAEQQLVIKELKKHGVLESLGDELKETARLREENPDASLGELCLMFSPPISKSGLNHRFKRLAEEAEKLLRN